MERCFTQQTQSEEDALQEKIVAGLNSIPVSTRAIINVTNDMEPDIEENIPHTDRMTI